MLAIGLRCAGIVLLMAASFVDRDFWFAAFWGCLLGLWLVSFGAKLGGK